MPTKSLITLLTDFGTADAFAASMKGVILNINPKATIVDITHEISPYGIRQAAFVLKSVYRYFPKGTIHIVVVDPGVGGSRKPLLLKHAAGYFIGPDNGIFSYIYNNKGKFKVYRLNAENYRFKSYSSTFDGRDLFAPVAAWLSKGIAPTTLGQRVKEYMSFPIPEPRWLADNSLRGEVIHADRFGNLITNITIDELRPWISARKTLTIIIKGQTIKGLKQCYGQAAPRELCALINSDDRLEIFCNQANAQFVLNANGDEHITVS